MSSPQNVIAKLLDSPLDNYNRYAISMSEFLKKAEVDEINYIFKCIKEVQLNEMWEESANPNQLRDQPYIALSFKDGSYEYFYLIVKCENNGHTFIVGYDYIIENL